MRYDMQSGKLIETIVDPQGDALKSLYRYEDGGKEVQISTEAKGKVRLKTVYYDHMGRIVKIKEGNEDVILKSGYDPFCIHEPAWQIDENGNRTRYTYDAQCRIVKIVHADGITEHLSYRWSEGVDLGTDHMGIGFPLRDPSVYRVTRYDSVGKVRIDYFDALKRVVRSVRKAAHDKEIVVDTIYDAYGHIKAQTLPYDRSKTTTAVKHWQQFAYDAMGKKIREVIPLSGDKEVVYRYRYDALETIVKSDTGEEKRILKDALGRIVKLTQNDGTELHYAYNALLKPTQVMAHGRTLLQVQYDDLGRKIAEISPERGTVRYGYTPFGELAWQKDNAGVVTRYRYDDKGRVIEKEANDYRYRFVYGSKNGSKNRPVRITYDSKEGSWIKSFAYDRLGRMVTKSLEVEGEMLEYRFKYDHSGNLSQVTYPSGLPFEYRYNIDGSLDKITVKKNLLWDYDFIELEKKLMETIKYIGELETKAMRIEKRIATYEKKEQAYRAAAADYERKIAGSKAQLSRINSATRYLNRKIRSYRSALKNISARIDKIRRSFGNIVLTYVRTVGKYGVYSFKKCVKKNWKGHCKRYKSYTFRFPKWMTSYCVRSWKRSRCTWGLRKKIRVSSLYANTSRYYRKKIARINRSVKRNERVSKRIQSRIKLYKERLSYAKSKAIRYAKLAHEESKFLLKIKKEIDAQKRIKQEYEEMIKEKMMDESSWTILKVTAYSEQGLPDGMLFGNGLAATMRHGIDATVEEIKLGVAKRLVAHYRYTYDERNRIVMRADMKHNIEERFAYDQSDRLVDWHLRHGSDVLHRTYAYDRFGNLTYCSDIGSLSYDARNRLRSIGSLKLPIAYDRNGNMVQKGSQRYRYDPFGRIVEIESLDTSRTTHLLYDENDATVYKVDPDGTRHITFDDFTLTYQEGTKGTHVKMYHRFRVGGDTVAVHLRERILQGIGGYEIEKRPDRTLYFLNDMQGAPLVVTDNVGNIVERSLVAPFGKIVKANRDTKYYGGLNGDNLVRYAGHGPLDHEGLIFM